MKRTITLLPILSAIFLFFSCQSDDIDDLRKDFQGHWKLEEIHSSWTQEVLKGADINYEESYHFRSDASFVKVNSELGRQVSGDFVQAPVGPGFHEDHVLQLTLTFNPDELVEEDTQTLSGMLYGVEGQEVLYLRKDGSLTNSG